MSVQDEENATDGVEYLTQATPIFVLCRLTHVVLRCLNKLRFNLNQANEKRVSRKMFALYSASVC